MTGTPVLFHFNHRKKRVQARYFDKTGENSQIGPALRHHCFSEFIWISNAVCSGTCAE